jgi:DtxR family transcriptional regulator, Mn-dependent transcriptional regulator
VQDGFHPPVEEYLQAILALEEEHTRVIQARLVERLGHSAPAISEMVRRLEAEGYVERSGRGVALTKKGRARAESVVRRHRLAERFLVDVLELPWDKAHVEAGRWEHVISDEVEERLVKLLGNPATCPHGNPIPGGPPVVESRTSLADASPGDLVRLERITEQIELDLAALSYLNDHGFVPGRDAQVTSRAPDGTLTLEHGGRSFAIGPAMCEQLFVAAI